MSEFENVFAIANLMRFYIKLKNILSFSRFLYCLHFLVYGTIISMVLKPMPYCHMTSTCIGLLPISSRVIWNPTESKALGNYLQTLF